MQHTYTRVQSYSFSFLIKWFKANWTLILLFCFFIFFLYYLSFLIKFLLFKFLVLLSYLLVLLRNSLKFKLPFYLLLDMFLLPNWLFEIIFKVIPLFMPFGWLLFNWLYAWRLNFNLMTMLITVVILIVLSLIVRLCLIALRLVWHLVLIHILIIIKVWMIVVWIKQIILLNDWYRLLDFMFLVSIILVDFNFIIKWTIKWLVFFLDLGLLIEKLYWLRTKVLLNLYLLVF